ncbi:sensor histidine kinase [Geothrix fermentans]|uniref:sensor histidine kinase n=1 Tax=Geothrix fermentans TaxID=44676 RepID=UPI00047BDFD3|nr:sensor histidine kinase [Geothrix fermentans]
MTMGWTGFQSLRRGRAGWHVATALSMGLLAAPLPAPGAAPAQVQGQVQGQMQGQAQGHRIWRAEAGLAQDTATALLEGRDGFLWIGTGDGLVRFDGASFDRFSRAKAPVFSHDDVRSLAETPDGSLWIGTSPSGLFRLKDGAFSALGPAEGLPDSPILHLHADARGTLWAAPGEGPLLRRVGERFEPVPCDAARLRIQAMASDGGDTLWVGTAGSGLWRVREHRLQLVTLSSVEDITALEVDAAGTLWVGTRAQGLFTLEDGRLVPAAPALPSAKPITALRATRQGGLWIGTEQAGLFHRTREGRLEAAPDGPRLRWTVRCLLEDRAGTLWVGSEDRGLRATFTVPFQAVPVRGPEPEEAGRMVCQDAAGTVWCLTGDQSLGQVREGRVEPVALSGVPGGPLAALWPRRAGGLWLGTRSGGLFILEHGRAQVVAWKGGPPPEGILSLYEDPAGNLWIATFRQGMLKLPPGGEAQVFPMAQGVTAMAGGGPEPLYLASPSRGVGILDLEGLHWFGPAQGLGSAGAQALHLDASGALWIGTADGLRLFQNGTFRRFTGPGGLLEASVHAILEDAGHNLWLCTSQGVLRAPQSALMQGLPAAGPSLLAVFDQGDGLPARAAHGGPQPAAWLTREGELWLSTGRGMARADSRALPPGPPPLRLHLVKVLSDESLQPVQGPLRLAPGGHRLEIHYTGISLTGAGKVRFRYRMEGVDPGWNEVGDRRFAVYSNLPPGARRFILQAWRPGEAGPPQEVALDVAVQPFFHQRPVFWILCAAAAGLFAWWLLRLRLQQVEARSAVLDERNRMAREIHDHLAQGFTGVLLQLEAAEARLSRMEGDPGPVLTRLDHARELAAASLQEARRSVMVLSPRKPEGTDLLGALRILSDRLLAGTGIRVELEQTGETKRLDSRLEEELLRMAQESLTNALRHGKAKWVKVTVQYRRGEVGLRIEDDGRGFDPATGAAGYGLRSIRETLARLRGRIDIDSGPGQGTRITINLPLRRWRP